MIQAGHWEGGQHGVYAAPPEHLFIAAPRPEVTSLRRAYERHLSDAAMQIDDRRTPAEILATGPELRIPTAAAQTRIVSVARIRMDSRKSVRLFSGIICDDISDDALTLPMLRRSERIPKFVTQ